MNAFHTTRWTEVLAAIGESPQAKQALRDLCETYYGPVEAFVQRYRNGHDDARDLTHEFLARLLEENSLLGVDRTRGRFRSYLLGAVKHFLADQHDRTKAKKRGGSASVLSLDEPVHSTDSDPGSLERIEVADPQGIPPDAFFDHQWALTIVEQAMSVLRSESHDRAELERFEVLKRWLIAPADRLAAIEEARSLEMTDGAFKVAVHRLRKRFRQIVHDKIAATVDTPDEVQAELDYLIQALSASR